MPVRFRSTTILVVSMLASLLALDIDEPANASRSKAAPAAVSPRSQPVPKLVPPRPAKLARSSKAAGKHGKPARLREQTWKRTASSRSFEMSDGTVQLELSPEPINYQDSKGRWQPIDTSVTKGSGSVAFTSARNRFEVRFGKSRSQIATLENAGRSISLAAGGDDAALKPEASGSTVTYPDVFGSADLEYRVSPTGLKEDIVLDERPARETKFSFTVRTRGLTARRIEGGGIGFFRGTQDDLPAYVIPAPVMRDSGGFRPRVIDWSSDIDLAMTRKGDALSITLDPDDAWLGDPSRVYPVRIDPTITVVPGPDDAQDATISSIAPTTAYPSNPTIGVGRYTSGSTSQYYRGLFKFDTSMIPTNTTIRSADLNLYYSSPWWSDANIVPISAVPLTKNWNEATATWADMNASYLNQYTYNTVIVDDADGDGATSFEGPWKRASDSRAIGAMLTWTPAAATTPDTFTWNARVPSPGNYRVSASYTPYTDRGTPTYQITSPSGPGLADTTVSASVNQAVAPAQSWAPWIQLVANKYFEPGRTASVTMTRQGGTTTTRPVADAIRLEKFSSQVKDKDQHDTWHSFAMGNLAQGWINGTSPNYGIQIMATNDVTAPLGGPLYHASEYSIQNAETRPRLVITYDEPGVTLNAPATIHADGPELTWTKYQDPSPASSDDIAEYQIFRGCRDLPGGACSAPVGDYFTTSAGNAQLVGTVASDITSFTDDSAEASTATESATYNYWVVARTTADVTSGQDGRAASNVQTVTTPREGRIVRVLSGNISDTTLSAAGPNSNYPRPDVTGTTGPNSNRYWLQVGNAHATYGDERAVMEFDTSSIKQGVKVTDAKLQLFEAFQAGGGGSSAIYDLHALTKDFVENEATWARASSTIDWTDGGEYEATPLASVNGLSTALPGWVTFADGGAAKALLGKVQSWVDSTGSNHGFLLKSRDETVSQQWLNFLNGESKSGLEPRLVVEHLVKNAAETYEANEIPQRWVPGTEITTPVTVTNTTDTAWPGNLELSYRWTLPGTTTDVADEGDRLEVALGRALEPGESVTKALTIRAPIQSDTGSKRLAYDLYLDLRQIGSSTWFSSIVPPGAPGPRPLQGCEVQDRGLLCVDRYIEDPTSNQLGLEKFLSYTGEETGSGSQLLENLSSGNTVWSYDAWSNPSIGPRSFVRLAYNSFDGSDAGAGFGVSLQPGTLTRLGSRLSVPSGGSTNNLMTFIDGDGTTHTYKRNDGKSTATKDVYDRPAGVPLDLVRDKSASDEQQWIFSRPDGTRFYYSQSEGLATSIVDHNGNRTQFNYDTSDRLISVQDGSPSNGTARVVLSLGYNSQGLVWVRDISGRALKFGYSSSHQLTSLQDGDKFDAATGQFGTDADIKTFQLRYTGLSTNSNNKIDRITDPLGGETNLTYWTSTTVPDSRFAEWLRSYSDRRAKATTFDYAAPTWNTDHSVTANVTDANGSTPSVTTYEMDGYGRTVSIKDANANATSSSDRTRLNWDNDHNVVRLEEPNGAVSTWRYDTATGYPLEIRDALAVKSGKPGIKLEYQQVWGVGLAQLTVLSKKTSAEGRVTNFGYDLQGNLATVRNGLGFGPTYDYDTDGTLAKVTDANNGITRYAGYDRNGYPATITDPMTFVTTFTYDVRGNVTQVKDAENRITTAEYDGFGRPTRVTTPYDGAVTRTTATIYDDNDNVTKVTAANGAATESTYDAADNLTSQKLPDNGAGVDRFVKYSYDSLGRTIEQTAPKGAATTSNPDDFVTRYSYDRIGQVLTVSTPFVENSVSKNPTTSYTYDNVGNQIKVVDPEKNASASLNDFTAKTVYDINHRPTAVTDALGFTSKTEYDRDGLVTAQIDARGNRKALVYDNAGQLIEQHVPQTPLGATQARDQVTKVVYDPAGRQTQVIRPSGVHQDMGYDANNRVTQRWSARPAGDFATTYPVTNLEYDKTGLMTSQSVPGSPTTKTTFSYFDSGEVRTSTDPWGISTSYAYNELGQQTTRTLTAAGDPATRSKYWTYNQDGSLATFGDSPAPQPTSVADNVDAWQARATGTWSTVTGGTNTQGTNYRTHAAAAAGTTAANDTFTWDVVVDIDGPYEVFASCPVRADASAAATYTVSHSAGSTNVTKPQSTCTASNPWLSLGTFNFTGGTTKSVVLKPATVGVVSADAIKIEPRSAQQGHSFQHQYDLNGQETAVLDVGANPKTDRFTTQYDGLGRPSLREELLGATVQRQTAYTYDLNSNPITTYAQQFAVTGLTAASRYTEYAFDLRNMVKSVKAGATPTSTLDQWSFEYDPRGMRSKLTKPNTNVQSSTYYEDGKLKFLTERVAGGSTADAVVSDHKLTYSVDGDLIRDDAKVDQGNSTNTIDQVSTYTYSLNQQLLSATKSGVATEKGDNETYVYDGAGNITQQTIGTSTSCMTYVKGRLTKTDARSGTTCASTLVETRNHRYDPFGRATTIDVGAQVVERNGFDGFDRLVRQQRWSSTGVHQVTKQTTYDAFDRPMVSAEKVLAQSAFTSTRFLYLGTSRQVAVEEQTNTGGAYEVSKAYAYGPGGEKLSLVDTPVNGSTTKKFYYGTNPRGDTETLTDNTGKVTSTYRYTAYGSPDTKGTTGDDAITGNLATDVDQVNPYRFNGSRFDGGTGTYDMGFREYNPGLNRFLSRDMYDGALDDMALGTDPWTTNRYGYAGGNPMSFIELDGHNLINAGGGTGSGDFLEYFESLSQPEQSNVSSSGACQCSGPVPLPRDDGADTPGGSSDSGGGGSFLTALGDGLGTALEWTKTNSDHLAQMTGGLLLSTAGAGLTAVSAGGTVACAPALIVPPVGATCEAVAVGGTLTGVAAMAAGYTLMAEGAGDLEGVSSGGGGGSSSGQPTAEEALATPRVGSTKLQNIVNNLYKGTTNPNRVGNGTTMDAIRNEIQTGIPTGNRFHSIKGEESLRGLQNWLRRNPSAPYTDQLVAQSLADDLFLALRGY